MLLALDTSTAATVVGVGSPDGTLVAERRHDPSTGQRPGHMTQLLSLADEALQEAGISWQDLTTIGAGVGPGGFTGIRIGIASSRALASSLDVPAVAIGSLDALAVDLHRTVIALIDARRGEVFARSFGADGSPQEDASARDPARLGELTGVLAVGDGAVRYRAALESRGAEVPADGDGRHRIRAGATIALTAAGKLISPVDLEPAYLRDPDAVAGSR